MWNDGNRPMKLSLTACPDGSFHCNDGMCIELAKKCDSSSDCQDDSDEKNCTILVVSNGYNRDIIPIRKHNGQSHSRSTVVVGMSILDILDIDISGTMRLKLNVILEWVDPRLDFLNLKDQSSLNVLNSNESGSIWKPDIVYINKEPSPSDYYVNAEPVISVVRNISAEPKILDWNPYMITEYLYSGETNPLQWRALIR